MFAQTLSQPLTDPLSPRRRPRRVALAALAVGVALLAVAALLSRLVTDGPDDQLQVRPAFQPMAQEAGSLAERREYPDQGIRLAPPPADAAPRLTAEDALKVDAGLGIYPPAALADAERRVELALYSNDQFRQIDAEPTFQDVLAWVITYDNVRLEGAGHGGARSLTPDDAKATVTHRTCTIISPVDASTGQSLNIAQACYLQSSDG